MHKHYYSSILLKCVSYSVMHRACAGQEACADHSAVACMERVLGISVVLFTVACRSISDYNVMLAECVSIALG